MWLYDGGIMRVLIDEHNSKRFRISKEGLPIVEDNLRSYGQLKSHVKLLDDMIHIFGYKSLDSSEEISY